MQYFKHYGTMRHDIKIKRVIAKYGLEGYGLYNLALESITESLCTESPMPDLQETCEDIAEFYNGNTAKINEIMNFMLNQGLFELEEVDGKILCTKLYKFLDTSQTRSVKLRGMINNYKASIKQSNGLIEDKSQTVTDYHRQSETSNDKSDRKEEEKKRKEEELEKNIEERKEIITYLNTKIKTNYKHNSSSLLKTVTARLNDGFTVDDFKKVIDKKSDEWFNTEMAQYLRPETLFGSKFESYLNAPIPVKKQEYNKPIELTDEERRAETRKKIEEARRVNNDT